MRKTPLKHIGRVGRANLTARKIIASIAEDMNITTCEIKLLGCEGNFGLAPAHRHKRAWYQGKPERLADVRQWVGACQHCHDIIEKDKQKTEETFLKLRGKE